MHPLVLSLATQPVGESRNFTFDVNITAIYGATIFLNEKEVFVLESYHNGSSTYTLTPFGNYGFGSAYQNFAAELRSPFPKLKVDELAEAVNGTLVRRESGKSLNESVAVNKGFEFGHHKFEHIREHLLELLANGAIDETRANHFIDSVVINEQNFQANRIILSYSEEQGLPAEVVNIGSHVLMS
jgi:hypothetical protein